MTEPADGECALARVRVSSDNTSVSSSKWKVVCPDCGGGGDYTDMWQKPPTSVHTHLRKYV